MRMILRMTYSCVLVLAGCTFCKGQDDSTPIKATLCELYQHPEQYAGKMIRVRGGSVSELRIENIVHDLPTERCPTYMRIIVVLPDRVKPAPDFQLVRDESYKKLEEALHKPVPTRIDATYEGRFDVAFMWRNGKRVRVGQDEVKGYGKKHGYDARIVLHQVFDVWATPIPRR